VRNEQKEIWKEIRYRKWKWIGHILRQENESIAKKALEWNRKEEEEEDPGLQAKHSEDGSRTSREELAGSKSSVKNRIRWRAIIKALSLRG
jgi:hypothetical protein